MTYTPNPDFASMDSFDYTVKDNNGAISNSATVSVMVNGFLPMAEDDEATTNQGESVTIDLIANDTDTDGTLDPTTIALVPPQYVANFDGINDKITWGNLGLDGTPRISKFIRFRTTRASGALFDYEMNTRFDAGFAFRHADTCNYVADFKIQASRSSMLYRRSTAADGQWHSVGFTYNGTTLTPYFDGLEAGTPTSVNDDTIHHNYTSIVGRRTLSNFMFFQGTVS